jgi:hypothetical protein
MKIRKFNEKKSEAKKILLVYDTGGFVKRAIVFDNENEMNTFILNFVNDYILNIEDEDFNFQDWGVTNLAQDKDGNYIIAEPFEAYKWLNIYNESNEPTLSWCDYEEEKNVQLDSRIEIALSAKQYNL